MSTFAAGLQCCPCCHCTGKCICYGHYRRMLVEMKDGKITVSAIRVQRVLCKSCNTTHAILPDPIIPYFSYSLLFIIDALYDFIHHVLKVDKICEKYQISASVLYRWYHKFLDHRSIWLGRLDCEEQSCGSFLDYVAQVDPYSSFAINFFKKSNMSFLQSHKNPANSQQAALGP